MVANNHVVNLRQDGSGCQEGNGIEARNAPFTKKGRDVASTDDAATRSAATRRPASSRTARSLTLVDQRRAGSARSPYIAQNGVQIGFGATGLVRGNAISDNVYTGPDLACGLLLIEADGVKQQANTFFGNERDVCNFGRGGGGVTPSS